MEKNIRNLLYFFRGFLLTKMNSDKKETVNWFHI